ncbi:zinc ribbon domain-containing protein [Sphaerisporangium sp. NPDC049003]|uniref:zinc ribbon domain-containing protein n=1 Tax=Sphaerisporangium sp. NPDC049003 TaxID=3364517 RepID=UPI0037118EB6
MSVQTCESCGMPMATAEDHAPGHPDGAWCAHCAPEGTLQPFEERFERMVQWQTQRTGQSRAEAETATKAYMRTLPAWRDHPALREEAR